MTYGDLAVGPHYVQVRATDRAGNADQSPATASFSVVGPDTTITSGPAGAVRATWATFGFGADENQATYQCAFDSTTFTACTSPATYTNLVPGSTHSFSVRALANDGRLDTTPATRSFSVDRVVDLGVTATAAPDPVKKGGTLTWTTQVRNLGASPAAGVRVIQSAPSGVTVTSTTTSDARAVCSSAAGSIRCDVADLAAGATWTVTVRGTVTTAKGTLPSTATVSSTTWDTNAANDTTSTTVRVGNGR
jgi:large repetitive protein